MDVGELIDPPPNKPTTTISTSTTKPFGLNGPPMYPFVGGDIVVQKKPFGRHANRKFMVLSGNVQQVVREKYGHVLEAKEILLVSIYPIDSLYMNVFSMCPEDLSCVGNINTWVEDL